MLRNRMRRIIHTKYEEGGQSMPEVFTLKQAAEALKVTRKTLYLWRKRGEIRFVKVGARFRVTAEELQRLTRCEG